LRMQQNSNKKLLTLLERFKLKRTLGCNKSRVFFVSLS